MKPALLFAPFALALAGCAAGPGASLPAAPVVRADGFARLGEPTRVGALVVTPLAVVEDSRCPQGVHCVWAGRLVLSAEIAGPGGREEARLTLGEPRTVQGRRLALVSAEPLKTSATNAGEALRFGFEGG